MKINHIKKLFLISTLVLPFISVESSALDKNDYDKKIYGHADSAWVNSSLRCYIIEDIFFIEILDKKGKASLPQQKIRGICAPGNYYRIIETNIIKNIEDNLEENLGIKKEGSEKADLSFKIEIIVHQISKIEKPKYVIEAYLLISESAISTFGRPTFSSPLDMYMHISNAEDELQLDNAIKEATDKALSEAIKNIAYLKVKEARLR